MARCLAAIAIIANVLWPQFTGAKAMFYDPADGRPTPAAELIKTAGQQLKAIKFARPFPQHGFVGIHYWFENASRTPFSEERAAMIGGRFTLFIRDNVGGGFLTVWAIDDGAGAQLMSAPDTFAHAGLPDQAGTIYTVPGDVQFTSSGSAKSVIILFSRSQTEQANSPTSARERFATISARKSPDGSTMTVRESDDSTPGEVGTYVVNRQGMPLAIEIVLRSR